MGTLFNSPASDIWALAVCMYIYYTGWSPFALSIKNNPLEVAMSLSGAEPLLKMYQKYRFNNIKQYHLLRKAEQNPTLYELLDLKTYRPDL